MYFVFFYNPIVSYTPLLLLSFLFALLYPNTHPPPFTQKHPHSLSPSVMHLLMVFVVVVVLFVERQAISLSPSIFNSSTTTYHLLPLHLLDLFQQQPDGGIGLVVGGLEGPELGIQQLELRHHPCPIQVLALLLDVGDDGGGLGDGGGPLLLLLLVAFLLLPFLARPLLVLIASVAAVLILILLAILILIVHHNHLLLAPPQSLIRCAKCLACRCEFVGEFLYLLQQLLFGLVGVLPFHLHQFGLCGLVLLLLLLQFLLQILRQRLQSRNCGIIVLSIFV